MVKMSPIKGFNEAEASLPRNTVSYRFEPISAAGARLQ